MIKYLILIILLTNGMTEAATYYTRSGIEVDKCASCWLIKKFVDRDAVFLIVPTDSILPKAIPFDLPEVEFSRKNGLTTYDAILQKYNLNDPALLRIAGLVKDAEINIIGKKRMEETIGLERIILGISELFQDDIICLQKSYIVFDALYAVFSKEMKKNNYNFKFQGIFFHGLSASCISLLYAL